MIAFVRGLFVRKSPAQVIVDVNGVGYEVHISLNTFSAIEGQTEGLLHTYLHIREDAQVLYGFAELAEKDMFVQLIGVNGIGAATARVMLSSIKPAEIATAILQGNVKLLESIKGIGKKTAERLVLELKDKLHKLPGTLNNASLVSNSLEQEALIALTALGIARSAAEQAVKKVLQLGAAPEKVEDIIKQALKII
ncbi:MAG: Holliday junction branch migration protein RuvA [Sphingobacteriales bacterium]|jgi:holliday junction DNA helicase RuvA|nr:MAG: Holliday junction branch migration protein RuvA [Sphingobacteriales bacterium]